MGTGSVVPALRRPARCKAVIVENRMQNPAPRRQGGEQPYIDQMGRHNSMTSEIHQIADDDENVGCRCGECNAVTNVRREQKGRFPVAERVATRD